LNNDDEKGNKLKRNMSTCVKFLNLCILGYEHHIWKNYETKFSINKILKGDDKN